MEVEGEATASDAQASQSEPASDVSQQRGGGAQAAKLTDRYDETVVMTVPDRHIEIAPGQSDSVSLHLLNNGDAPQVFEVTVQGEVSPAWFPELPVRLGLRPGERQVLSLQVALPAGPEAEAGTYHYAIRAQAIETPHRYSRAVCTVVIAPHTDFWLGPLQPEHVTASWWSPTARTRLPVANLSNHGVEFEIMGADSERMCVFEFDTPDEVYGQAGRASFRLGSGERSAVGVTILPRSQRVIGLRTAESPFRIAVRNAGGDAPQRTQVTEGRVLHQALIGPWQMTVFGSIAIALLLVFLVASAALLLALRDNESQPAAAPTAVPAPAFALVLSMDEPVPTPAPSSPPVADSDPTAVSPAAPIVVIPPAENGLPVVQSGQVTAPGEPTAPSQAMAVQPAEPARPTPVAVAPSNSNGMTYAQMFQQISARYDLNWRVLAAQGYVESGFDSNAVGAKGSLGLMQIHPETWQEWAPYVDVSDPYDTYANVLVAAIYLDYLRATLGQAGQPQVEWMLAAYNWGPDKVLALLDAGGEWSDLPVEVQRYATDVLRIAQSIPEN